MRLHHSTAVSEVWAAIEAGRVLHAIHPDFGGVLTVGPFCWATGETGFAAIHHGGPVGLDLTYEGGWGAGDVARYFVNQVGKHIAHAAAEWAAARGN